MKIIILLYFLVTFAFDLNSFLFCHKLTHPNSMKQTIDYTKSGSNWPGVCQSGTLQSPISIDMYDKLESDILDFNYGKSQGKLKWNGSFYKIDFEDNDSKAIFTYNKVKPARTIEYVLKRLIFRTPPEHIVEGEPNDLELQFVHDSTNKKESNNLLIISVFAKVTDHLKTANNWWNRINLDGDYNSSVEGVVGILTTLRDYIYYEGSQTIPNCVENVNWIVFKKSIYIGRHHFNTLKSNICKSEFPKGNARKLQNRNGRELVQYSLENHHNYY